MNPLHALQGPLGSKFGDNHQFPEAQGTTQRGRFFSAPLVESQTLTQSHKLPISRGREHTAAAELSIVDGSFTYLRETLLVNGCPT
jgi:hypothetical protein